MEQDHLRIVVDGGGTAEREGAPERPARQPTTLTRPTHALPTDRMRFETQVEALAAFARATRGDNVAGAKDIAARIGVTEATAALVNSFFVGVGFLTKVGKGRYKAV